MFSIIQVNSGMASETEVVQTHCFWGYIASSGDGHACGKLKQVV